MRRGIMLFPVNLLIFEAIVAILSTGNSIFALETSQNQNQRPGTIVVTILVRNKAHTLPYFLHYFEKLDYPKERIALWIRADHCIDDSTNIMEKWLEKVKNQYHWIDYKTTNNGFGYESEQSPCDWTRERFNNVINLRQEALNTARSFWADYIFYTDLDNFLVNDKVLLDLISQHKTIVSPMLNATASQHYSNFWGGMDEHGYYMRSRDYKDIQLRYKQGCHQVVLVHSTMLIDLRQEESRHLAYKPSPPQYKGPYDDLIIFAHSAKYNHVSMYILNSDFYGFMLIPMSENDTLTHEKEQFLHLQLEAIVYKEPLQKLDYLDAAFSETAQSKLGFDNIYMVNLERRKDRHDKMKSLFDTLGIQAQFVKAVDGKQLNDTYLSDLGIEMLPHFSDPYSGRPMTLGEIGCFLSHYGIWQDMVKHQYKQVIVFEDDIRFEMYFKHGLQSVMEEVEDAKIDWDLIYIGRKRLNHKMESWVVGADRLVWPHYSYWTLGYLLSLSGATKLLAQEPLKRMVPVDEYLPIMFDRHVEDKWLEHFSPRDLVALSAEPLLVYPTHYTGEPGYFTDTEDSQVVGATISTHNDPETEPPDSDNDKKEFKLLRPGPQAEPNVRSLDEL